MGCFYGLRTTGGTQGVGRSTTQAMVVATVLIFVLDLLLTKIFIGTGGFMNGRTTRAPSVLRFENVSVSFDGAAGAGRRLVRGREGESHVILGAAGSGKTVLLKTAMGLVSPMRARSSSSARTSPP